MAVDSCIIRFLDKLIARSRCRSDSFELIHNDKFYFNKFIITALVIIVKHFKIMVVNMFWVFKRCLNIFTL